MAEADDQSYFAEIRLTSQHCFYMESQSALAIPDEDKYMVVYSSIQAPVYAQSVIAGCLNISEHNVRVITMRVRGGFGGKDGHRACVIKNGLTEPDWIADGKECLIVAILVYMSSSNGDGCRHQPQNIVGLVSPH